MVNTRRVSIIITGKRLIVGLFLLGLWLGSLFLVYRLGGQRGLEKAEKDQNGFVLLNPRLQRLAGLSVEERRAKTLVTLASLKKELLDYLGEGSNDVAFYVEDLNTGAWAGWQEREEFIAASFLKVPIAITAMKEVDQGSWTLETPFAMEARYKDKNFGSLWQTPEGSEISVEKLLKEMLQYSDNTAANILFDKLAASERDDVYFHIGIANPEAPIEQAANRPVFRKLSTKDLATMFRALYNATFLTRKSSNYILEILTQTKFDKVLATEIPPEVKVAHKIANFFVKDPDMPKNFHDCGIVYLPNHPYLYCAMTKNLNADEAQSIIVELGNKIYNFFARE